MREHTARKRIADEVLPYRRGAYMTTLLAPPANLV